MTGWIRVCRSDRRLGTPSDNSQYAISCRVFLMLDKHTGYANIPRMWYSVIQLQTFMSAWKSLKLTDADLQALEVILLKNPQCGDVMQGTGGLRKVRFAPPSMHTGKSGGTRVVYIFLQEGSAFYLFTIFGKTSRANLTAAEKSLYRSVVLDLRNYLKQRRKP